MKLELKLAAGPEDLKFLFEARTHPKVDQMLSGNPPIDYQSHVDYIKRIQSIDKWIYIAFINEERVAYSQIYDVTEESLEVGFVIHPDFQGRGYGRKLIKETIALAKNSFISKKIVLYVKKSNNRAAFLYLKLGFVCEGVKDDTFYMELKG